MDQRFGIENDLMRSRDQPYYILKINFGSGRPFGGSLVDFFASIITIAPSLALAHSGASALPGVLALSLTEPVLRLVDVAVNHQLSCFLVFFQIGRAHV